MLYKEPAHKKDGSKRHNRQQCHQEEANCPPRVWWLASGILQARPGHSCPQVVPYTECSLGMEPQPYTQSLLTPKLFTEKVCSQGKKVSAGRN